MSLKEKLVSSFLAFELDTDIMSNVHKIRSQSIKEFEKIGFPNSKDEYWKYTPEYISNIHLLNLEIQFFQILLSIVILFYEHLTLCLYQVQMLKMRKQVFLLVTY